MGKFLNLSTSILNQLPSQRIKPNFLRDVKTEALLVFIRTTLEQYFKQKTKNDFKSNLGSEEQIKTIEKNLELLFNNLSIHFVNAHYLYTILNTTKRTQQLKLLIKKEEPLMIYYDAIVKGLSVHLENGTNWIPEMLIITLLSEWLLEEEKSAHLFPFLNEINYLELITIYDEIKLNADDEKKAVIMNMYKLSTKLISVLKNTKFKNKKFKTYKK